LTSRRRRRPFDRHGAEDRRQPAANHPRPGHDHPPAAPPHPAGQAGGAWRVPGHPPRGAPMRPEGLARAFYADV